MNFLTMENIVKKLNKKNGNASIIILENVVFSDKKFECCKKLEIVDERACAI